MVYKAGTEAKKELNRLGALPTTINAKTTLFKKCCDSCFTAYADYQATEKQVNKIEIRFKEISLIKTKLHT